MTTTSSLYFPLTYIQFLTPLLYKKSNSRRLQPQGNKIKLNTLKYLVVCIDTSSSSCISEQFQIIFTKEEVREKI